MVGTHLNHDTISGQHDRHRPGHALQEFLDAPDYDSAIIGIFCTAFPAGRKPSGQNLRSRQHVPGHGDRTVQTENIKGLTSPATRSRTTRFGLFDVGSGGSGSAGPGKATPSSTTDSACSRAAKTPREARTNRPASTLKTPNRRPGKSPGLPEDEIRLRRRRRDLDGGTGPQSANTSAEAGDETRSPATASASNAPASPSRTSCPLLIGGRRARPALRRHRRGRRQCDRGQPRRGHPPRRHGDPTSRQSRCWATRSTTTRTSPARWH